MSITKNTETTSRASLITIDKSSPEKAQVIFKFVAGEDNLGIQKHSLEGMIEAEIVTLEEVGQVEAIFKRIADHYNPYGVFLIVLKFF
jgi:hypothetical protein